MGVGAGAGALAGREKSRDRNRDRDRDRGGGRKRRDRSYSSYSSSRSRSRSRGHGTKGVDQKEKIQKAVKAALIAGAGEAFRSRKEPGGWAGDKGKRVLTAAIGAGGIDGLLGSGKDDKGGGTMQTIQSVIGGLAGNRLINGARDKDGSRSRSRSRSRGGRRDEKEGGGGLAGLAAGGLAAAAGKALLDRNKSKDRGRRYSSSSDDSRRGGRGSGKRSKSVSDYARQGMAAIGIRGDRGKSSRGSRRGYDDDAYDYPPPRPRGGGGEGGDGIGSSPATSDETSSDDDVSSSEEERERKKMGRKELITAGLASVATIHAAQSVYKSVEGRKARAKEVAKGEMSPQEARKKKNKARLQDAASIGIAALGIKGAYGEWKEMKEQRDEAHEFDEKRRERHERRLAKLEARNYKATHGYIDAPESYRASAPDLNSTAYPPYYPAASAPDLNPHHYYSHPVSPVYHQPMGPHYSDGNPYATVPDSVSPPPMGLQQQIRD